MLSEMCRRGRPNEYKYQHEHEHEHEHEDAHDVGVIASLRGARAP